MPALDSARLAEVLMRVGAGCQPDDWRRLLPTLRHADQKQHVSSWSESSQERPEGSSTRARFQLPKGIGSCRRVPEPECV